MVFENPDASVDQVRRRHRKKEVREVIPAEYAGVLITDRSKSYDAQTLAEVPQQMGFAHLQRNLSEVLAQKQGHGMWFAGKLKRLLGANLAVWQRHREGEWMADPEGYARVRATLIRQLDWHLRDLRLRDPDNHRLLDEIGWHHDRGNRLRFPQEPDPVEPTTGYPQCGCRAERA